MTKLNPNEVNQGDLGEIVSKIRGSFISKANLRFILLYAYNGVGKTRLSREFKSRGSILDDNGNEIDDTLYFNSYTEDLFQWDNENLLLRINHNSSFFAILESHDDIGIRIRDFFKNYAKVYFEFKAYDVEKPEESWTVEFFDTPDSDEGTRIKISRGEERIFIWCFFLAIMQYVLDEDQDVGNSEYSDEEYRKYGWVKYIYIDDPISSLDDNNAILVATDLADIIKDHYIKMRNKDDEKKNNSRIKIVFSTHHGLFYNVLLNELEGFKWNTTESYVIKRDDISNIYSLIPPKSVPFFYHLSIMNDLEAAYLSGNINYYHFSMLRVVLEKISAFFGYNAVSDCIPNEEKRSIYNRVVNLRSHGKHSLYEITNVSDEEKDIFKSIFEDIKNKYNFSLS
ncbi:ATP-binding protein [Deinococcus aquaedulcis]|uniref:hypothetical protein n=1 Tax=Deinococcus aquaedulcis TaxID=2840455 RepID=UPI001C83F777|nr:hypothetical protein [Deinococcus aquaedulcis]